jgi:transposase
MTIDDTAEVAEPVLMDSHATDRMATRGPRIRVIARAERKRIWSIERKREIVAESLSGGMPVSAVARKHDMSPGLLFTWRRQMLAGELDVAAPAPPSFARVDVVAAHRRIGVDRNGCRDAGAGDLHAAATTADRRAGMMEIVLAGATVRVDASVDQAALRRVLAALVRR